MNFQIKPDLCYQNAIKQTHKFLIELLKFTKIFALQVKMFKTNKKLKEKKNQAKH